jgi:precorrin-2 C20-methyltransferase/precorrin-3B C17-methyltransferase
MAGRLFGVGVGPGDPELITVKALRRIEQADVVAYPVKRHNSSVARRAAAPYLEGKRELALTYPVTTEGTDHPEGYDGALREFYDESAERIAEHLDAGRDVAVLCEGDPFFYGSYMYLHERLAGRYRTEVVAGVTSFSAAAAAAGTPLAKRDDVLTVLPGTLPPDVLAARLQSCDAAVVLKLGRTFEGVREAAERAGVAERGVYVERASAREERVAPLREIEGSVPYMSLVLVPTARERPRGANGRPGSVAVVGLGPAGPQWLTPEAQAELAAADALVGYATYLARVPTRPGQARHASDNRVEAERARHALSLAAAGERVAVVSSGDPGIFAMASAVLEAVEAENGRFAGVDVRVVPGLSAMQAAAARAGAPLGHDFCVLSLSDNLKPWHIVERRLRAASAADLVLALYNPASRSRRDQLARAVAVLREDRASATPVVVARAVGSDAESVHITTLSALDCETVDMRTLLIVGSSTTRLAGGAVYTPRHYPG